MAVGQRMMSPETQTADPGSAFRFCSAGKPAERLAVLLFNRHESSYPRAAVFSSSPFRKSVLFRFDRLLKSGTVEQPIQHGADLAKHRVIAGSNHPDEASFLSART